MKRIQFGSRVYKNARWEPKNWGSKKYKLTGDEVPRELKDRYRITLNESYRENGKVKKRQWHILSLSYWDIVDDWVFDAEFRTNRSTLSAEGYEYKWGVIDYNEREIYRRIEKHFSDLQHDDYDRIIKLISDKLKPIGDEIIQEYKQSEEYKIRLENESLREKGPREPTEQELQEQEESEKTKKQFMELLAGGKKTSDSRAETAQKPASMEKMIVGILENKDLAREIINEGYNRLSEKYHPDSGGSEEQMQELDKVKEDLDRSLL